MQREVITRYTCEKCNFCTEIKGSVLEYKSCPSCNTGDVYFARSNDLDRLITSSNARGGSNSPCW